MVQARDFMDDHARLVREDEVLEEIEDLRSILGM
jgi:hypothetical protein